MAKQFFNAHSIDSLIDESIKESDQLSAELSNINSNGGLSIDDLELDDINVDDEVDNSSQETKIVRKNNDETDELIENENSDDYLDEDSKTWSNHKGIVEKDLGSSISFNYVYKKIAQMIDNGNATLELLQSIDPDASNPATLGACASLMNSIHGCIAEFTKIHQQYIKFQNAIRLEQIKHENKKDIIRFRKRVNEGKDTEEKQTELIEVNSGDIFNYLEYQKTKESEKK